VFLTPDDSFFNGTNNLLILVCKLLLSSFLFCFGVLLIYKIADSFVNLLCLMSPREIICITSGAEVNAH